MSSDTSNHHHHPYPLKSTTFFGNEWLPGSLILSNHCQCERSLDSGLLLHIHSCLGDYNEGVSYKALEWWSVHVCFSSVSSSVCQTVSLDDVVNLRVESVSELLLAGVLTLQAQCTSSDKESDQNLLLIFHILFHEVKKEVFMINKTDQKYRKIYSNTVIWKYLKFDLFMWCKAEFSASSSSSVSHNPSEIILIQ